MLPPGPWGRTPMLIVLRERATHWHRPIDFFVYALPSLRMMVGSHDRMHTVRHCGMASSMRPTLGLATISHRPTALGSSLLNSDCCRFCASRPIVSCRSRAQRLPPAPV